MARIGDFASAAAPIGPDTPGAQVFDRFQDEPDTLVIAVVDGAGRPVGLIERNAFTLKMAAEFGRALADWASEAAGETRYLRFGLDFE